VVQHRRWAHQEGEAPIGGRNPTPTEEFMKTWGTQEYLKGLMQRLAEKDSHKKPPGAVLVDGIKCRGGTQGKVMFSAGKSDLQEINKWTLLA